MPERARRFCPPLSVPHEQGVIFYSPVDFAFRVRDHGVDFQFRTDEGDLRERTITDQGEVLISHFSTAWHEEASAVYRERLVGEPVPRGFDRDDPQYPDQLIGVTHEGEFGYLISVWTGVVIELDPGQKLYVKDPPHLQLFDRGFRMLDAIIESDRWHGHFGAVFSTHRRNSWLSVSRDEPLFQGLVYQLSDDELQHVDLVDVPRDTFLDPLRWNFDPYRRNSLVLGKYLNQLRRQPTWDCRWEEQEQRFAERRADVSPDTWLALRMPPVLTMDEARISIVFSEEDRIEVTEPALRPFLVGLGSAPPVFRVDDALRWSRAGQPGYPTGSEIVEHLRTLIWHDLVTIQRNPARTSRPRGQG